MSKPKHISVELLLVGCRNNDRKAQEEMYRYFYPLMMPVCMGYASHINDAVDIYNRSFLKVFTKLSEYNGDGAFEGWVRKIIVHTAIDYIRREEKHKKKTWILKRCIICRGTPPPWTRCCPMICFG